MNLRMGSQVFRDVQIPVLWGARAILQDKKGRLSIVDLGGPKARLEILADEPASGVSFRPSVDGIIILHDGEAIYSYNSREKLISSIGLKLPDCQISGQGLRIGGSQFSGNFFSGFGVGIAVSKGGAISVGAPLPQGLAKLAV